MPRAELEAHPHAVEHTEAAPARRQLLPLLVVAEGAGAARGGEVRVAFEAVLRHLSTARGVKRRRSQLEGTRTGAAPVHSWGCEETPFTPRATLAAVLRHEQRHARLGHADNVRVADRRLGEGNGGGKQKRRGRPTAVRRRGRRTGRTHRHARLATRDAEHLPHLPLSPPSSPYLAIPRPISPALLISPPHISPGLARSRHISPDLACWSRK